LNNGENSTDNEGKKENVCPIDTKKARRLQEEQDFIERTAAALGKHLNCQNFGMSPHFQQTMADFVEAMNQNMALQQMAGGDPSIVAAIKTELAKVNLHKLQESAKRAKEEEEAE
jgi:hypothetical protein